MSVEHKKSTLAIFGLILALGLMASAFIMGTQFKNLRQTGTITVKGVAEAEHKSSYGTWRIAVNSWGATYDAAMKNNQVNLNIAVKFLEQQGFLAEERSITHLDVSPYNEPYRNEKGEREYRQNGYTATRYIHLTTQDLTRIERGMVSIQQLRAENQNIDFREPEYYLDDLQTIKRNLIANATQDAYIRAEEFAKTSKVTVGKLKSASQGAFDIRSDRPDDEGDSDYGGSYSTSTINKKVRLVVTIEYAIE